MVSKPTEEELKEIQEILSKRKKRNRFNIKEEENNLYLIFYTFVAVKEQKNVFKFIFLSFSPPATTT